MGRTDLRPDITKEVLEEYIRKGYSQNRIAITLGTTQSTIFNKLKKYGLQVQKTKPSNYDEKALIKQLQNGWTTEQIARYFGVCTGTVGSWISKNKLGKYRKASPKKFDAKLCNTCIYGTGKKTDMDRCNYLSITGHSRNKGQPEDVCSKYAKGRKIRGRKELYNL